MSAANDDKFGWGAGPLVLSQCAYCKHLADGPTAACAAFPHAIPQEILANQFDHRRPWTDPETGEPGDLGMVGTESILFEPRDDAKPEALRDLYDTLDQLAD